MEKKSETLVFSFIPFNTSENKKKQATLYNLILRNSLKKDMQSIKRNFFRINAVFLVNIPYFLSITGKLMITFNLNLLNDVRKIFF